MKKILWCILIISFLVLLDQGAKLAVDHFYVEPDGVMQVSNTIHIHPELNSDVTQKFDIHAEKTGLNYYFWSCADALVNSVIMLLLFGFVYSICRFFFWDTDVKWYSALAPVWICPMVAAGICRYYFDNILWKGCLDFICISWNDQAAVEDHLHNVVKHLHFDLKDLYLYTGLIVFLIYIILFGISFIKLNMTSRVPKC